MKLVFMEDANKFFPMKGTMNIFTLIVDVSNSNASILNPIFSVLEKSFTQRIVYISRHIDVGLMASCSLIII